MSDKNPRTETSEPSETPLVGVDAGKSPDVDVMPGSKTRRLAGKRTDESDAELRDEEDIPPPS